MYVKYDAFTSCRTGRAGAAPPLNFGLGIEEPRCEIKRAIPQYANTPRRTYVRVSQVYQGPEGRGVGRGKEKRGREKESCRNERKRHQGKENEIERETMRKEQRTKEKGREERREKEREGEKGRSGIKACRRRRGDEGAEGDLLKNGVVKHSTHIVSHLSPILPLQAPNSRALSHIHVYTCTHIFAGAFQPFPPPRHLHSGGG